MKLSELRSAIRKMKGNPSIIIELTPGKPMLLVLQKTPTLETLGSVYGSESGDIGLTLDEGTGIISGPQSPVLDAGPADWSALDLDDDAIMAEMDAHMDDDEDML